MSVCWRGTAHFAAVPEIMDDSPYTVRLTRLSPKSDSQVRCVVANHGTNAIVLDRTRTGELFATSDIGSYFNLIDFLPDVEQIS